MTFGRILTGLAAAALLLLSPGRAGAQQADTLRVSTSVWTSCPGAYVRVSVRAGERVDGRCGPVADGRLQVRVRGAERQIRLAEVDSLWMRRSYLAESTLLLAVAGAAAGALMGGDMERCEEVGCTGPYGFGRGGRAAIGAVAGAGLGVLVGPRITGWRRRFP